MTTTWENKRNNINLPFLILVLLILTSFFLRGFDIDFVNLPSTSFLIPLFTVILGISILFSSSKLVVNFPYHFVVIGLALLFFSVASLLGNLAFYDETGQIIHFGAELFLNFALFLVVYVWSNELDYHRLFDVILIAGIGFSILIFHIAFFELDAIRRVGNTELPVGVNHLSHALAVALMLGVCRILYRDDHQYSSFLSVVLIGSAMLLTGSRSGLAAILVAVVILAMIEGYRIFKDIVLLGGGLSLLVIVLFSVALEFTGGGGFDRLSISAIFTTLTGRLETQIQFLGKVFGDPQSALIGIGMEHYRIVSPDGIGDPHNLWVSFAVYVGVPAALAFFSLHLFITILGFRTVAYNHSNRDLIVPLLLMVVITTVYSFFSGRMTRIFTIWIAMGLLLGCVVNLNRPIQSN